MARRVEQTPELRRSGIGGSDAAAILGVGAGRNALDVYAEKVGTVDEREEAEAMYWGKALESVVLEELVIREKLPVMGYARDGELAIWVPGDGVPERREPGPYAWLMEGTLRHSEYPWMMCHPDGFVLSPDTWEPVAFVEAKTASAYAASKWGDGPDEIPVEYLVQVLHNAIIIQDQVRGAMGEVYLPPVVPVLIGGQKFRIYRPFADGLPAEMAHSLIEAERKFWVAVQQKRLPLDMVDTVRPQAVAKLYPRENPGEELVVGEGHGLDLLAKELAEARARLAEAQAAVEDAEARLKLNMGATERLIGPNWKATWKTVKDSVVTDWRAVAETFAQHLDADYVKQVLSRHQEVKPGYRRFTFTISNGRE